MQSIRRRVVLMLGTTMLATTLAVSPAVASVAPEPSVRPAPVRVEAPTALPVAAGVIASLAVWCVGGGLSNTVATQAWSLIRQRRLADARNTIDAAVQGCVFGGVGRVCRWVGPCKSLVEKVSRDAAERWVRSRS